MNTISPFYTATATSQMLALQARDTQTPLALKQAGNLDASSAISLQAKPVSEQQLRDNFTQFVGQTFYGQMFKAMRSTVGKPAYFNGGRAEEIFQSQLDQTLSEEMTKRTASTFAEPMFERQFPRFAEHKSANDLAQLDQLSRR